MSWGGIFDADKKESRIKELESIMAGAGFWSDQASANKTIKELKSLKLVLISYRAQREILTDLEELARMVESDDAHSISEIEKDIALLDKQVSHAEFNRMLGGPDDQAGAILSINAGAGGTESCDWVRKLLRRYPRWAED